MDYRKPRIFGENWSPTRYEVLPYFAHEWQWITPERRILEVGCANGWNLSRFGQYGVRAYGIELNGETVRHALAHGEVGVASGLQLPFADGSFDLIYVQHVLHHIGDVQQALKEIGRCLVEGGTLFLIETVEDSPLITIGRNLHDNWLGDEITARFSFAEMGGWVKSADFTVTHAEQYSILFWVWEMFPDQYPLMEQFTPKAVAMERLLLPWGKRWGAHAFWIAHKNHKS